MNRQVENNIQRPFEILIHIIGWSILFGFPLLFFSKEANNITWIGYLKHSMVPITFLIVFYLNYFLLVPRFFLTRQTKKYIALNIVLILLMGLWLHGWQSFTAPPIPRATPRHPIPPGWIFFLRDLLLMILVAGLSATIRMSGRWIQAETARREAEKSRAEAELKNLKNQLNPHFLLNTLNNIYALITFDTEKAQEAVQELSRLLRYVLYDNQQNFVPLSKEAEFIRNYIELMRIRVSPEVVIKTTIDILPHSGTLIAPLLFISLIENAFKHGISSTEPSYIHILLQEDDHGTVTCHIINSNYPKPTADKSGSGIGLEQVKRRLELSYPGKYYWNTSLSSDGKEYSSILEIKTI